MTVSAGERGTAGFGGHARVPRRSSACRTLPGRRVHHVLIDTEKESIPDCGAVGTFDRGFWENGRGHERRTELVTPLSVTRSTSTDRVDMVPRFSGLNPGNTARAPVCRADVPRVPEQFPEEVTHSTGLRSRLAADRASRRKDARRCAVRRYPRCHKPRATAYRRPRVSPLPLATAEWRPRPLGTARGIFEYLRVPRGRTN